MKVCITGFAGFVGRHITKRCLDMGFDVTGIDDLSTGKMPKTPYRGLYEFMDVRDWFKDNDADYDLVFHCAAIVGGRKMIDGAPLHVATDLSIDAEFFNWCVGGTKRPRKVIYFSSSAVYPVELQTRQLHCALSESLVNFKTTRIAMPDMTYGWAKLTGEYLMQHAVETYDLDCVCYRPFSGYGEDQDFSYPFPSIIQRVGRRENPVHVWGSGEQVRDFIHIDDVVNAVFASLGKMKPGETLNLGTGEATSFLDLAKLAGNVINHSAPVVANPDQPEGVFHRVADIYNMDHYYTPEISLEDGIKRVYEWQQSQGLLTRETVTV